MRTRRHLTESIAAVTLVLAVGGCADSTQPSPVVDAVAVSPATDTLVSVGATTQLTAQPLDAAGDPIAGLTATWSTSAAGVATVDGAGLVTAVADGDAELSASVQGVTGSAVIVVAVPMPTVDSVFVSPASDTLTSAGDSVRLAAAVFDAFGAPIFGLPVTWATSATGVASVDTTGLVTAVANGGVWITATVEGVADSARIVVDIPSPVPLAFLRESGPDNDNWVYLLDADTGLETLVVQMPTQTNAEAMILAPDATRILYLSGPYVPSPPPYPDETWQLLDLGPGAANPVLTCADCPRVESWSSQSDRILWADSVLLISSNPDFTDPDTIDIGPQLLALTGQGNAITPTWAPDEGEIAFACDVFAGLYHALCVLELASDSVRFVQDPGDPAGIIVSGDLAPSWSPDGLWIAVGGSRVTFPGGMPVEGSERIDLIRPDGTEVRTLLTAGAGYVELRNPTWSPDSSRLAFECRPYICVVDIATGIVTETVVGEDPSWAN